MTIYAQAHLLMLDISKRFEAVIARNPKYNKSKWRVENARHSGTMQRHSLSFDLTMADLALRNKP